MAFIHGRGQVVSIDGDSLTAFSNSMEFERKVDTHDVTCFGASAHNYRAGLRDGTATIEGIYDSTTSTGPGAIIRPLLQSLPVELKWRPEGTGAGLEESDVDVIVVSFKQSAPVDDMISWTCEVQFCEAIDDTAQA